MHVVLLADPELPVPPLRYGGIERIVDFLARGLEARGDRVTLFANAKSATAGELRPWSGRRSSSKRDTLRNAAQLGLYMARHGASVDVVHSFARLAYLTPVLLCPIPKVQSYQREITQGRVRWGHVLSRGTLRFTSCGAHCIASGVVGTWTVIPNGVDLTTYDATSDLPADAPLMFLGRIEPIKGLHHAIAVARRTDRRLVVAGNVPTTGPHQDYARRMLDACDGEQVTYVGSVDDAQKNVLLGAAACLLFPIEWEEPFGIVMAEALACGTPVVGFRRGSVPEVVVPGKTGFICSGVDDMVSAVGRLGELDRGDCRRAAEDRFSARAIVPQYAALYRREGRGLGS